MNAVRLVGAYRLFYCLLIIVASVQTLAAEHEVAHVVALASAEIAGALLLSWRRTQWLGLTVLLLVFAGAQLMAAVAATWPTRFLQYAGSALLIVMLDRALGGESPPSARCLADGHPSS
jgi:hypothetical protein